MHERLAAGTHDLDEFLLLVRKRGLHEQTGRSNDAVHRSADLVTHVGEEIRFRFLRDFRLALRDLDFFDRLMELVGGLAEAFRHLVERRMHPFDLRWARFEQSVVVATLGDGIHSFGETAETAREPPGHEHEGGEERDDTDKWEEVPQLEDVGEKESLGCDLRFHGGENVGSVHDGGNDTSEREGSSVSDRGAKFVRDRGNVCEFIRESRDHGAARNERFQEEFGNLRLVFVLLEIW